LLPKKDDLTKTRNEKWNHGLKRQAFSLTKSLGKQTKGKGFWKLTLAFMLVILTLITHQFISRYEISDEALLVNGSFDAGLSGWTLEKSDRELVSVSDGEIHIHAAVAGQNPKLWQNIDFSRVGQFVYLGAWVKAEHIVAGEKTWNRGRIIFQQLRDVKPNYSIPHVLAALDGTRGWQYYESIFPIHSESDGALVMIQMSNATGVLSCKNMTLAKASVNPYYKIARSVVLSCWICMFVILFYPHFINNQKAVSGRLITLFLLAAILTGTMMSGTTKSSIISLIAHEENSMVEKLIDESMPGAELEPVGPRIDYEWIIDITKSAHFFLFALLSLALLWSSTSENIWYVIMAVIILACGTELAQLFVEGRSALTKDIALDLTGSALGASMWLALRRNDKSKS
jgi:VanZ family protein